MAYGTKDYYKKLRETAEEFVKNAPDHSSVVSDYKNVIQELQVYQLELQMQVDELLQTQKELAEMRDRYSTLFNFAPVSYIILNHAGIIEHTNFTFLNLVAKEPSKVLGKPLTQFLSSVSQKDFLARYRAIFKNPQNKRLFFNVIAKDGKEKAVQFETVADANQEENKAEPHTSILATITDIDDLKKTEKRLADSESRYRTLVDSSPFGILAIDNSGIITNINRKLVGLIDQFEMSQIGEQIQHHPVLHKYHILQKIQSALETQLPESSEFSITDVHGELLYIHYHIDLIFDAQKIVSGVLVVFKNVTQEKKETEMLLQSQKMEAIGTMAGGIAHDFNNILSIIIGNTELAIEDLGDSHPAHEYLEMVFDGSMRAKQLIAQILSFSRSKEPAKEFVNISTFLKESIKLLRASIPATIKFEYDIPATNGSVYANSTQLSQVLLNICTNAVHAMNYEGVLQIQLQEIQISDQEATDELGEGEYYKISISDTGCGIDKNLLERIFDPYFTTKERGKGTGMGLSVVYGIAKAHRGHIAVESELSAGATFHLFLPMMKSKHIIPEKVDEVFETGTEHILVVDDEPQIAMMVKYILKALGYFVTSFAEPIKALKVFEKNPDQFDLVISDVTMPDLPGYKLATKLLEIRSDIPIILCTGYSDKLDPEEAYQLGIKSFLMKPLTKNMLAKEIRKVLDQH